MTTLEELKHALEIYEDYASIEDLEYPSWWPILQAARAHMSPGQIIITLPKGRKGEEINIKNNSRAEVVIQSGDTVPIPEGVISAGELMCVIVNGYNDKSEESISKLPRLERLIQQRDSQLLASRIPEGWQLVPIEPTEEMIEQTRPLWTVSPVGVPFYGNPHGMLNLWRTMLQAAPTVTAKGGA